MVSYLVGVHDVVGLSVEHVVGTIARHTKEATAAGDVKDIVDGNGGRRNPWR